MIGNRSRANEQPPSLHWSATSKLESFTAGLSACAVLARFYLGERAMSDLDPTALEFLVLLNEGHMSVRDGRLNPLTVLDLKDAGLIRIDMHEKAVALTDKGREALMTTSQADA